jgi:hypothetical protein
MTDITAILKNYLSIGLDEMDSVNFMNRTDTKYLFNISKLPALLQSAVDDYRILEIDHTRMFSYNTTYLDTPDYLLYNNHIKGKMGRFKIRVRTYESSGISYLEIKNKTNKGRTVKSRIKKKKDVLINEGKGLDFIREITSEDIQDLKPMLTNRFTRVTLTNLILKERITIDFNLTFSSSNGRFYEVPYLAIAEVKRDKSSGLSPFVKHIKDMGIRETGFSKYCVGLALLNDVGRQNIIKPKLLMLNKIKDESIKHSIS